MRTVRLFDALYSYGLYALLYILMQAGRKGFAFFAEIDHLALLVALLAQTWLLAERLNRPGLRFLGALIAPAVYTVFGLFAEIRWFTDMSHAFFWLTALPLAALGAWGRFNIWAISAAGLINVFIFVFIFFFFEIKANAAYYQHFTTLSVTAQDVHLLFFFDALKLFIEEPHHRYIILGGLVLGLFIALAQARALQNAQALDRLNRELEKRVREGVQKQVEQERLLIQQSRMAALGEMMGMIAHQWKQPLAIISLLSQSAQAGLSKARADKKQIGEDLKTLDDQVAFMNQTAQDFRDFLKPSRRKIPFDVTQAALSALSLTSRLIEQGGIRLNVEKPDEPLMVTGYPNEFRQVMMNLLINAQEAILSRDDLKSGRIALRIESAGKQAVITVEDNGGGIEAEAFAHLFDPHFSTKVSGSGLGLYMARTIIEAHMGGQIRAENSGEGARLTLFLPLDEQDGGA